MEQQFKVSVVIPVYNAEKFVEEAVLSATTLEEVGEVILVEDGSSDNSLAVCERIVKNNNKVKLLRHENGANRGAAETRNLGIKAAQFPYVSFLDSDDAYFKNRFDNSKRIFREQSDVAGVHELVLLCNLVDKTEKKFGIKYLEYSQLFRNILRGGYFHTNGLTINRQFLQSQAPFNQYCWPHEDVEMWLRLAFFGKIVTPQNSEPVASYRLYGTNNITNSNHESRIKLWATVYRFWFWKDIGMINRLIILKQMMRWNFIKK